MATRVHGVQMHACCCRYQFFSICGGHEAFCLSESVITGRCYLYSLWKWHFKGGFLESRPLSGEMWLNSVMLFWKFGSFTSACEAQSMILLSKQLLTLNSSILCPSLLRQADRLRWMNAWAWGWGWGWGAGLGEVGEVKAGRVHPSSPIGQERPTKSALLWSPGVNRIPPRPWGL